MSLDPLTAILNVGESVINRIWPDANKRAEEMRKLEELKQAGDLAQLEAHVKLLTGQMQVNLEEAKHGSLLVAGWRPAIGWVGAISLALIYWPKALALTGIWIWQCATIMSSAVDPATVVIPDFPDLGVSDLIGLLMSMLGVGIMRSFDKSKGVQTDAISGNRDIAKG